MNSMPPLIGLLLEGSSGNCRREPDAPVVLRRIEMTRCRFDRLGAAIAFLCGAMWLGCDTRPAPPPKVDPVPQPGAEPNRPNKVAEKPVDPPAPKPVEVVPAWERAAFKAGWLEPSDTDGLKFVHKSDHPQRLFAFGTSWIGPGRIAKLPPPDRPFGVSLPHGDDINASLKELAAVGYNLEALML